MRGIEKTFVGVKANSGVDMDLERGEVHTLLGENGAGKSTLMNILSGLYTADSGAIVINGEPRILRSPRDAIRAGIGMVHQHFMLVPTLSVWENVSLGLDDQPFFLDKGRVIEKVGDIQKRYGINVDPMAPIWQLSIGEQQRVAIIKTLYRSADILILDEPTSVLTPRRQGPFSGPSVRSRPRDMESYSYPTSLTRSWIYQTGSPFFGRVGRWPLLM